MPTSEQILGELHFARGRIAGPTAISAADRWDMSGKVESNSYDSAEAMFAALDE